MKMVVETLADGINTTVRSVVSIADKASVFSSVLSFIMVSTVQFIELLIADAPGENITSFLVKAI